MNSPIQQDNNLKHKAKIYTGVAYQEDSECSLVAELQFELKIYSKTWKWLSSNDQQPIWQSLKNFENKNGQTMHNPGVERCQRLTQKDSLL